MSSCGCPYAMSMCAATAVCTSWWTATKKPSYTAVERKTNSRGNTSVSCLLSRSEWPCIHASSPACWSETSAHQGGARRASRGGTPRLEKQQPTNLVLSRCRRSHAPTDHVRRRCLDNCPWLHFKCELNQAIYQVPILLKGGTTSRLSQEGVR